MFDDLRCEYRPFPVPEMQDRIFQTKDLDCQLNLLTITSDGRLLKHDNWEDKDSYLDYSGEIQFYDFEDEWKDYLTSKNELVYFVAVFEDGKLISIEKL